MKMETARKEHEINNEDTIFHWMSEQPRHQANQPAQSKKVK